MCLTRARPPGAADIQGFDNGDRGRAREGSRSLSLNLIACPASFVQKLMLTRLENGCITRILVDLMNADPEIFSSGRDKEENGHDTKKQTPARCRGAAIKDNSRRVMIDQLGSTIAILIISCVVIGLMSFLCLHGSIGIV